MRYFVGLVLALALGFTGCSETAGTAGDAVFPCTEQGIRDAVSRDGGPHTFDCDGPTVVVTEASIIIQNPVILDGEGNLTVDAAAAAGAFSVRDAVELRRLTVTNNAHTQGGSHAGCIDIAQSGALMLTQSTVSDCTCEVRDGRCSAGISSSGGVAEILNSTVSGFADIGGWGTLSLLHATVDTFIHWGEGEVFASRSIVGGCSAGDFGPGFFSRGYNIESPGDTCNFHQPTDQVNVSAEALGLRPLADNRGGTETHALGSASVAIDWIPEEDCVDRDTDPLTIDQRGEPRPGGSMCDVGAFEVQP